MLKHALRRLSPSLSPSAPALSGAPFIGNLLEFRRAPLDALDRAARENGPITRINLVVESLYFVNHPDPIRRVLVDNHRNYSRTKNLEVPTIKGFLGAGLLTTDGDLWLRLRRASQPVFGQTGVAAIASRIKEALETVLKDWDARIANGEAIDIFPEVVALTFVTAMRAFFDYACSADEARKCAQTMLSGQEHILKEIKYPLPAWLPTPARKRYNRANEGLEALIEHAVRLRTERAAPREAKDMIDLLFGYRERATGAALTETELRDQVVTNLVAAPENTATAITWCLYLLTRHPEIEARVRREMDEPKSNGDAPPNSYLRRVIDETLRLYPGAPYFDRRALGDDVLGGCQIPKGSMVMIAPYVLHRDPTFFRQPTAFDPERFADGLSNRAYMPFGIGPRKCIGDRFALTLLGLVIPELLRRYRFALATNESVKVDPLINLRPRGGMPMRVTALERKDRSAS